MVYSKQIKALNNLKKQLVIYSKKLLFERAEGVKNKIIAIKSIRSKTVVVSKKNISVDCFYIMSINYLDLTLNLILTKNMYIFMSQKL